MRISIIVCDLCKKELKKGTRYFLIQEREIGTRERYGNCMSVCKSCYNFNSSIRSKNIKQQVKEK